MDGHSDTPFNLLSFDPPAPGEPLSEQVCFDNPLAVEVAQALFNANINVAAMTWRDGYRSTRFHYTDIHLINLHLQGKMSVILGTHDNIIELQPGDLVYCPPGCGFSRVGQKGHFAQWLYFQISDTPFWDPLKDNGFFVRQYDSAAMMYLLLRRILDAHKSRDRMAMGAARGDARMLVTVLGRLRRHGPKEVSPQTLSLRRLVRDITARPAETWTQRRMTGHMHVSPSTLLRLCRETYGVSPKDLIIRIRMSTAAQLLTDTDAQLVDIAERVGYKSVYSFSRIFRENMGAPPIRFRRNSRSMLTENDPDLDAG